ncbi:hypothetical protein F4801DRAFT_594180 [Xylaria longipes]|nr:hypothetical protein F4801DRAFT_594180 [Xylaria longipes]RYC65786.1 hypothetical protein CHU98_g460 [Xylaria longipes]
MASPKGTIVLTGSSGGLGCALVSKIISTPELVQHHSIYTVRSTPSPAAKLQSILSRAPKTHTYDVRSLDLSRLANVKEFASDLNARVATGEIAPIRALILNAGMNDMGKQSFTEDGFDTSFASNYLSHWVLTLLLLQSMDLEAGRIVIVGSGTHDVDHPINKLTGYYNEEWKTFLTNDNIESIAKGTWCSNDVGTPDVVGGRRYGVSKMCAIMMIGELQRRLDTDPLLKGISVVGIDPGVMPTGIMRHSGWIMRTIVFPIITGLIAQSMTLFRANPPIRTTTRSANALIAAAFEAGPRLRGKYLDGSELSEVSREAADVKKREMVWRESVGLTRLTQEDTKLVDWA